MPSGQFISTGTQGSCTEPSAGYAQGVGFVAWVTNTSHGSKIEGAAYLATDK
jgi:hypothetical protein